MGIGGIWQWVVVLVIILLLFGTKRLRNLGADLGHAVKGFRKGMKTDSDSDPDKLSATSDTTTDDTATADAGTTTKSSVSGDK